MDRKTDKQALRRFEAIIRPHFDALHRAAMRLTRSREDAEDLVQDVVLRALPEIDRLAALEAPRAWLLRVQYRIFVDGFRRRARAPLADNVDGDDGDRAVSDAPSPEELVDDHLRARQLARVWPRLDRRQRALLAMHAEGYTLAELEQITGLSRNALGVRLHRARARLARLIRNETASVIPLVRMEV
jgi:RNA polymerase sigma factor (sigma-70 family)